MSARAVERDAEPPPRRYKMKELSAITGMPRQAIHFYIQEGLVPEGHKTGRNMAYYDDRHVERIRLVRTLQHERFLPLKAIRAVIEGKDDVFTPAQRRLLLDVKRRLPRDLAERPPASDIVPAAPVLARVGLDRKDLDEMVEIGLVEATRVRGKLMIARSSVWLLELWGEVRGLGFTRELGFPARVLALYERGIQALVDREVELLTSRLEQVSPEKAAAMVDRGLPLIGTFLARFHEAKVREFFASV